MKNRTGIIVGTNAGDQSYDVLMLDNGAQLVGVQMLSKNATDRSGTFDMLDIPVKADKWDVSGGDSNTYTRAVIGFSSGHPFVHGFLPPQINQMAFDDPKMRINRHTSDVITSIDGDGNVELAHPSGTYIRIGETPDHVDLSGKNADASLKVDRNTERKVNVRVALAGNVVKLTMTPEGSVVFEIEKDFGITAGGAINMKAAGDVNIEAGGKVNMTAASEIVANAPKLVNPAGDIIATGVSLIDHPHKDTMPMVGATSGPPVPTA